MDKLKWFKFSPADWVMGRIQKCTLPTQAEFIRLCCVYWNNECVMSLDECELELSPEGFKELLKYQIFKVKEGFVKIDFMDCQLNEVSEISKVKRKAANARWCKSNAGALQLHDSAMPIDKKREEEKREDDMGDYKNLQVGFVPPTLLELKAYFNEKGYAESRAIQAFNHYEASDWRNTAGQKLTNWKQSMVNNWFKPEFKIIKPELRQPTRQ